MKVVKRDGRFVVFDDQKIYDALLKATQQVNGPLQASDHQVIHQIVTQINQEIAARFKKNVKIYEIQNIVEHTLIQNHLYQLAEQFEELGAATAYNLDGGGSSTLYFNGKVVNQTVGGSDNSEERAVSDILYFK